MSSLNRVNLRADLCIVGGGVAGVCAALAAARHGIQVVLMHDRPVPGGNASSEIRMWIRGARGKNCRETGIIEELLLEDLYKNPKGSMSIWDSILYGKLQYAENLTLLLNTSCLDAEMAGDRIASVTGWQSNSQTYYRVEADYFADCSGDSILAALTPALHRSGREAASEFNESIEPAVADKYTMGSSCLIQIREWQEEVPFIAPEWADKYTSEEQLPTHRDYEAAYGQNFWYLELGGMEDVIKDADAHRERLLRLAFGVWDFLKNYSKNKAAWAKWELEWVGFLPGKRESRRYQGAYTMSQRDVEAGGKFPDMVAYGGWTMDDHHPAGFEYPGPPTIYHPAPSPFGIAYRCLYSANIPNLFFAGRNISVTHAALSSARVMGTCASLGQAMGTAAAIAALNRISPAAVYEEHITELQQQLLEDDCFLPGMQRQLSDISLSAMVSSSNTCDAQALLDGYDRPWKDDEHCWSGSIGDSVTLQWDNPVSAKRIRIVFDSNLNRIDDSTVALRFLNQADKAVPETLVTAFKLEYLDVDGTWKLLEKVQENHQRLYVLKRTVEMRALRLTLLAGKAPELKVFSFDAK